MSQADLLLYASSDKEADIFYFSRIAIPDPFLAFRIQGKKIAIVDALEYTRTLKTSAFDSVLLKEDCVKMAEKELNLSEASPLVQVILWMMARHGVAGFKIPANFPSFLCLELLRHTVKLEVQTPLFPERLIKTEPEIAALRLANKASALGLQTAQKILQASSIHKGKLYYEDKILSSERLRSYIEKACLDAGAISMGAIVAGGDQACDPHDRGSGPLKANSFIIVDVFPRATATGYYGDMTRTFLKGKANAQQKNLIQTVMQAQKMALGLIKDGVKAAFVHESVQELFVKAGYNTYKKGDTYLGFFHSTGHGLGLDLHEAPGLSLKSSEKLKTGMVVTVEPGLYYPGLGGVRIEDVVAVEDHGYSLLSKFNYRWEIP